MRPPAVSTPCVGAWRSTTSSATPSSMSASPPQLGLSTENPYRASTRADGAERAGEHDSGMEHLEDEPDDPEQEEQADQVRVDDRVEETRDEARLDRVDLRSREMQREGTLRVLRLVAVELVEEGGERGRDEVDHVHLQRLLGREVRGDAHRFLRPRRIAVMGGREGGERGHGVVDHLAAQVRAEVLCRSSRWASTSRCSSSATWRGRRPPGRPRLRPRRRGRLPVTRRRSPEAVEASSAW